jgi:hypothetical protein
MGSTFPAACAFWGIMREVSMAYFSGEQDPMKSISIDFAELKYREILAWAETLPPSVVRDGRCPHHVLIFQ